MATLQGEMLTRIARAHQRAVTAEYALQEAKEALKKTREANDLEIAKAEKKAAALELGAALDETTQLPLPGTGNSPGEIDAAIERAVGAPMQPGWERAARVVTA